MKETIHYGSDQAASFKTGLEGWVSPDGRFWGDNEHMARWSGCTHVDCRECGAYTEKSYTHCEVCREKRRVERYRALERKEWNGDDALYSDSHDTYFFDLEGIIEHCEEHGTAVDDLYLMICEPQSLQQIDPEYWEDVLPEDWGYHELPGAVQTALDTLNAAIAEAPPISWAPGKYAAIVHVD